MPSSHSPFSWVTLASAAIAAVIIIGYLVRRPKLTGVTKLWLLAGLGVFPILTAGVGNVQGFEATTKRSFCASCHVMTEHTGDSDNLASTSLSARHARNKLFGDKNCYVCHADYGMYGTLLTKEGGMKHVYYYYLGGYRSLSMAEAKAKIRIHAPYPNENCMQCHSTEDKLWADRPDHKAALADVRADRISCASSGCHGLAHPYWRTDP